MSKESRTKQTAKNMTWGFASQFVAMVLSFVSRTVFIRYLGAEYLGINSVFSDVLNLLSMADLGFNTAMAYSFYKPLAMKDEKKLAALVTFYSNVYRIIAISITVIGLILVPFLRVIVKTETDIPLLEVYYLFSLAGVIISYLFVYKTTILTADQKNYELTSINIYISFGKTFLQILALVLWQNYIVYLAIGVVLQFIRNLIATRKAEKYYPYIKNKEKLSKEDKESIYKNLRSVVIYKLSNTLFTGTDNIIISMIVGIGIAGLYSNYLMISQKLLLVLQIIFSALTASIGNVIAKENSQKRYEVFVSIQSLSFIMSGVITCGFFLVINDFITVWLGANFTLDFLTVVAITLNTYLSCILQPFWVYRDATGLYMKTKYVSLAGSILNIVLSVILGLWLGLAGILLATVISRLSSYFLYEPIVLFKDFFDKSATGYYTSIAKNALIALASCVLLKLLLDRFTIDSWPKLIVEIIFVGLVVSLIYIIFYHNTDGFKMISNKVKSFIKKRS